MSAALATTEFTTTDIQILKVTGYEKISELYSFDIDVVMRTELPLPPKAVPGAKCSLVLTHDAGERKIHGMLASVEDRLEALNNHRLYRLRLVPEMSGLQLVETQQVYVGQTVPAIITDKLDLHDLAGTRLTKNLGTYTARDLVVQYKESDLAFVRRLAEHLGISFVFSHAHATDEAVIFSDNVGSTGLPKELFPTMVFNTAGERTGVFSLSVKKQMIPSAYIVQDYNYRTPLVANLGTVDIAAEGHGGGVLEYGSHHVDPTEGASLATVRSQERLSTREVYTGQSVLVGLTAGARPNLTSHPMLTGSPELLILEVKHEATFGSEPNATPAYVNTFTAISSTVRYRPPRLTPRPKIHGLVTGTIALGSGTSGGLAQIDSAGRYLVQFHHDAVHHTGASKPSHPIRMAQPFAGSSHGFHFPLRPGSEVILSFLDGDPDRPIIVGSVPNTGAPSTTTLSNSKRNRVSFASGVLFEIGEGK